MQVEASRSEDIAHGNNHYKSGYWKTDTNPRDGSTLVRLPRFGKMLGN